MVILYGICNGYINIYIMYNDIVIKNCCLLYMWCNCVNGVMNVIGGYICKNMIRERVMGYIEWFLVIGGVGYF